jgi:PAS domain S-box-containing protein
VKQARLTLHEQQEELRRAQEILVEDINRRKCAEALLSAEKHTLQMIAEGAVLRDVLDDLCRAIDEQSPGVMSMVSMIDPDGQHLRPIAGPRVPEGWRRTINPLAIGPRAGSCGTAAFRMQPVVVADIASDSLWAESRDVAMSYGLRACWSAPLVSTTGDMLGTFATYYPEPRNPREGDLTLIERAAQVARIAIERELVRKALRDSEQRFRLMVEGMKDYAIFMLDTEGRVASWNAGAERIKGYRAEEILGQHFSRFYPAEEIAKGEPKKQLELATATDRIEDEGWRVRKDGTRFWADALITALRDQAGKLIGFAKVTRDITERKQAEAELLALKEELAIELTAMTRLHEFSTRLLARTELEPMLEEVLDATIALQNADLGNVQLYNPQTQTLEIVAQRGFQQDFLDYFTSVHEDSSACGRALQRRERVIIEDVETDAAFEPHRHIAAAAGFRGVQLTPLFSRSGEPLGMISTHFRQPHRPSERELRLTDLYVMQAAELIERNQARAVLEQAFEEIDNLKERLHHENVALREEIDRTLMFEEIVGSSPAVRAVLSRVAKVAPMDSTVLITGETGTGKELIARAIHKRSKRANRAFVAFNCAGILPTLITSELFGHEKGAFTGAQQRRLGRFELAAGGTIFLDEIGELPTETQIALLRVLQEREFERVGGSQPISIDVRVITASNRDLEDAIAGGTFRLDLFHRLNVFPIEVPTLRERKEDIPMLLDYFITRYAEKAGKTIRSIDKKTVELFKSYSWPGNIRELQNVIERSMILCESEIFSVDESWLSRASQPRPSSSTLAESLHEEEKKIIEAALAESKGRIAGRSGAAAKLGIPSSTLESKIKLLKIKKNHFKTE